MKTRLPPPNDLHIVILSGLLQKFNNYCKFNTMSTKELLEKDNLIRPPKVGEIIEGKIVARVAGAIYLDLGVMGTGIIYGKEFYNAKNQLKGLKVEDALFAKIIDLENEDGFRELSVSGASKELTWKSLRQSKEQGETINVKISGANKGGLLTEIAGIPAFLPVSQLSQDHYPRVEGGQTSKILQELQKFVGQTLEVKVFDLSLAEEKLILSEKSKETEKIKEVLKNYRVGDVIDGEITGLTDFGAFMKFNKEGTVPEFIEGLIHISELDWKIIEDPSEIVKVGEKVKAKIIDISNDKVSLSLKSLKRDPWIDIETKHKKGDEVSGKVTKFNPFGAFIQLNPEIQGLIHISEFGTKIKMEEKLELGKKYNFQILEIRPQEHRMSLKLAE